MANEPTRLTDWLNRLKEKAAKTEPDKPAEKVKPKTGKKST